MSKMYVCVESKIEYEKKRRIKLTHCASLIKRESLRERIDVATMMKYCIKEWKFYSHQRCFLISIVHFFFSRDI